MDTRTPQRAPDAGRTRLRAGDRLFELDDAEWERWVRSGWVPPDSMVLSALWTKGVWRRAETLEVYHLFRPSTAAGAGGIGWGGMRRRVIPTPGETIRSASEAATSGLPRAIWGHGLSVTQVLLLINLAVSALLVFLWRDDFTARLWLFSGELRALLMRGWVPVLFVPLFLHASAGHLVGNMVALTASGAAVEEFHGPLRTLLLYVAAGLCGAVLSLARVHTMEIGPQHVTVLAVGASGAIMGLYGVILVFLLRHRKGFPERERRKTQRIYFPLLVLALLPSLFGADLYSHVGGFVGGMLLALVVRPIEDRIPRERTEPSPEPPESLR